jgi:hypothetical protein
MRNDLGLPEAVERVLNKAMQRDPAARYQTTLEFAEAFAAASTELPSAESHLLGKLFGR